MVNCLKISVGFAPIRAVPQSEFKDFSKQGSQILSYPSVLLNQHSSNQAYF